MVGATHYPVTPNSFFAISFGRSITRPSVFLCSDFAPLDGLELVFVGESGAVVDQHRGPWQSGRTFVPLPQLAVGLSVAYKSVRGDLAPPASLLLEWLAGTL